MVAFFSRRGLQLESLQAGVGFCDAEAGAPFAFDEAREHAFALFWRRKLGDRLLSQ